MTEYIGAIDQGTTSTRFIIFDRNCKIVGSAQKEHRQIYPKPGWVEHDPLEIWKNTIEVILSAIKKTKIIFSDIVAIGIANQRETTVVWDRKNGMPFYNAIVWQCTRTEQICNEVLKGGSADQIRRKTGLPVSTYFSGPKLKWILENVQPVADAVKKGDALFGTIESWLIWRLTGGPRNGIHVTDVTNASRTMLLNLKTLEWDEDILRELSIPCSMLPQVVSCSATEPWGVTDAEGPLGFSVPICGSVGDQQAALIGQRCFERGDAKNTYGTGCFLLLNTGNSPLFSNHGMITTVGYKFGSGRAFYCLEGAVAIAGALIQWLRDNLGLITSSSDVEPLASAVPDNGGIYIVPAFSGLYAPYWRSDARGAIVGLTGYATKSHIVRAALEACAYQTRDIVESMEEDTGIELLKLRVDGGMTKNEFFLQMQADILNVPLIRPSMIETTAMGAAYAAGLGIGLWNGVEELALLEGSEKTWKPACDEEARASGYKYWKKAVQRTLNWVES